MTNLTIEPVVLDGSDVLDRAQVGRKAWSVNHLRRLGLPVPPAFALGVDVCRATLEIGSLPDGGIEALAAGIAYLEAEAGQQFGGTERPLFVSVRSGAARSMPGMMDTVLNVGAGPASLAAVSASRGPGHAHDLADRLATQFAKVVGQPPPDDPFQQLVDAATAVFRSWQSPRALAYRRQRGLSDAGGSAVTVQAMVFGNLDDRSGAGVVFTRNPITGASTPLGEWLPGAQGEDVVSGRVTPHPLAELAASQPGVHAELLAAARTLERDALDVQDIEFTVESGRLWLLQTRRAMLCPEAVVRATVAMRREGLLTVQQAIERVGADDLQTMLRPAIDPQAAQTSRVVASGEPASPGLAAGTVVTTSKEAEDRSHQGEDVVLATTTTSPDDIHGMVAARAVLTELGGSTSHAAVVSREIGRPCVVGCGPASLVGLVGREVTVDGGAGRVYAGRLPIVTAVSVDDADIREIARWLKVEDITEVATALSQRILSGETP